MIGLEHEQFGIEPGTREVPVGGLVALIRGDVAGQEVPVVVVGVVTRQGQQTHQGQRDRTDQDRARPAHQRRADPSPEPHSHGPLGFQRADLCGRHHYRGSQGQRRGDDHHHAHRHRNTQRLEHRTAGEVQAQHRAGDGQSRPQDDVCRAVEHLVVGRYLVLAPGAGLLIPAEQEDDVVGGGGDRHQSQQAHRERRQTDQVVVSQDGDHTAGHRRLDTHHEQRQQHRDDRPVDEQQHDRDDDERQQCRQLEASVTGDVGVGRQRRRARDVGGDPGRSRHTLDDLLGSGH